MCDFLSDIRLEPLFVKIVDIKFAMGSITKDNCWLWMHVEKNSHKN